MASVLYNLVLIIVLRSKEGFVRSCIATRSPERGLGGGCAQDCPSVYSDDCNGLTLLIPCSDGQSVMAAVNQVGTMQLCRQTANCMIDTLLYYYTARLTPGMQLDPDGQVLCTGSGWFVRENNNDVPIIGVSCASDPGMPPP